MQVFVQSVFFVLVSDLFAEVSAKTVYALTSFQTHETDNDAFLSTTRRVTH